MALWAGAAAGLLGSGLKAGALALKKAPKVPGLTPIDVAAEQAKAIQGNITNYGLISQLSDLANKTSLEQGLARIDTLLGGGTRQQIVDLIQTGLRGELPKDITDLIARRSAERGVSRGVPGSVFARNLELRDLGLTSLATTQQALDTATRWLQTSNALVPQFDFSSMFISPAQAIAQANINQQNTFQRDWLKNQLDNMFSSSNKWAMRLEDLGNTLQSFGSIGGLGGQQQQQPPPPPPGGGGGGGGMGGGWNINFPGANPGNWISSYQYPNMFGSW